MGELKKQIISYKSYFGVLYSTIATQCACGYDNFMTWLFKDGRLSEREVMNIVAYMKKNDWR